MFATSSADTTEMFDGRPVVRLPDHPADLADFLQYLMPCSEPRCVLFYSYLHTTTTATTTTSPSPIPCQIA